MSLDLINNLINDIKESNFVQNFINELSKYIAKSTNNEVIDNEYSNYWLYQTFIEDAIASKIGLSRYSADITYYDDIYVATNESILEIAKEEGTTLYRSKYPANGTVGEQFYNVKKFENGEITSMKISKNDMPEEYQDKDIIFQIEDNGSITVRTDLQEEVINLTSKNMSNLKDLENERNNEYKKEGHIYEAIEDDGYVFLNDLTEERGFIIEDIDFVVQNYEGDGKYQVTDGIYVKIDD